jgi:hypothetical protein
MPNIIKLGQLTRAFACFRVFGGKGVRRVSGTLVRGLTGPFLVVTGWSRKTIMFVHSTASEVVGKSLEIDEDRDVSVLCHRHNGRRDEVPSLRPRSARPPISSTTTPTTASAK